MTPQESTLLQTFLSQLVAAGQVPRDREADALIQRAASEQPDALYLVVQRTLIQQQALDAAQRRIAELERAASESPAAAAPSSFLAGDGWGRSAAGTADRGGPQQGAAGPSRNPGGNEAGGRLTGAPPAAGTATAGAAPSSRWAPGGSRAGGFLGQAAAMAAGVAGGAFLFHGIGNLLGHGAGAGAGDFLNSGGLAPQAENLTVNEFIESPTDGADLARNDYAGDDGGVRDVDADAGDQGDGGGPDFGGDDFGFDADDGMI